MTYKIFKDNEQINIIESSEEFVETYCKRMGYTYEEDVRPEPEPIPEPEPTPTDEEVMWEIEADHELRIAYLELGITAEDMADNE